MKKMTEHHFHGGKAGAAITVQVIPGAKANKISEVLGDGTLKIHLNAASTDDDINQCLIQFLASEFKVQPTQVEILGGIKGKEKLISILGVDAGYIQQQVMQALH